MHSFERTTRSQEFQVIKTNVQGQKVSEQYYHQDDSSNEYEEPQLVMYQILRSLVRKQIRKPFLIIKQLLTISESSEESMEIGYKHSRYELEVIEQNLHNVCSQYLRKLLTEGFLTIKNAFLKRQRVEKAYYNVQNLTKLNISMTFTQNIQRIYLKWQGFGRLYENYKGLKLSKINLSKIDMINNDYTQFSDFNPFIIEKGRQIEAINSYIIDHSSQNEENSSELYQQSRKQLKIEVKSVEKQHQSIEKHYETTEKRCVKKSSTAYYDLKEVKDSDDLEQKVLITHRKQIEHEEAGTTNKLNRESNQTGNQHLFLIRDYRIKEETPTNYIKIPVATENLKIVEIQTGRKKTQKVRVEKSQVQIQRQICENCKFCMQMRERKQIMKTVQQRFQTLKISQSFSSQILSK